MGNSATTGQVLASTNAIDLDNGFRAMVNMSHIEPWSVKDLIRANLHEQARLRWISPLRHVVVDAGLQIFNEKVSRLDGRVGKRDFIKACLSVLRSMNMQGVGGALDEGILAHVFDSLKFDGTKDRLSKGEWAIGLTTYFKGTQEDCSDAVFTLLDTGGKGFLSRSELKTYLTSFVAAMTPPEAEGLRPLLLKKTTADLFTEMDAAHDDQISPLELLRWMQAGNNLLDRLMAIIEQQVTKIWLECQFTHPKLREDQWQWKSTSADSEHYRRKAVQTETDHKGSVIRSWLLPLGLCEHTDERTKERTVRGTERALGAPAHAA